MFKIQINQLNLESKQIPLKLDLEIMSGQTILLTAKNGRGKSSLIKSILGFNGYTFDGEIKFKQQNLKSLSISERILLGIGVVFQQPPKFKNTSFIDLLSEKDVDNRWTIDLSQNLNIYEHIYQNINQNLSGGEQRRTELWQALWDKPDLLLLDELDSGVDAESFECMYSVLMSYLEKPTRSAIIITHSPEKYKSLNPIQHTIL